MKLLARGARAFAWFWWDFLIGDTPELFFATGAIVVAALLDPSSWRLGRHPSPCDGRRLLGGEYDPRSQAHARPGFEQRDVVGWLRLVAGRSLTPPLRAATRTETGGEIRRTRSHARTTTAATRVSFHSGLATPRGALRLEDETAWGEIILEGVVMRIAVRYRCPTDDSSNERAKRSALSKRSSQGSRVL